MQYEEYKQNFIGFNYQGPELYHLWAAGTPVDAAKEKLAARGRTPGGKFRGRGISDLNLRLGLAKAVILWCDRMAQRRLTESQTAFVAEAKERATKI